MKSLKYYEYNCQYKTTFIFILLNYLFIEFILFYYIYKVVTLNNFKYTIQTKVQDVNNVTKNKKNISMVNKQ